MTEIVSSLEFTIVCGEMWTEYIEKKPTYFKKHSAAEAWRYRYTPSLIEEVWIPEGNL